jgi:guanylate kinase
MNDCERGKLIVVSGPSGAGKSTVIARLMREDPDVVFSVSATTRPPREGEIDGKSYFFVTREKFQSMVENGELLEHAEYVGNCYGTPKAPVLASLKTGKSVLFDIEVQGAAQIKAQCPEAILIFVVPSDFSQIEKRLRARGTDSEEKIQGRLMQARRECERATNYDYVVLNDDPDRAADEMRSIITAEKCKMANRRNYLNMEVSLS